LKEKIRMDGQVGVELYESGFDYLGYRRDLKMSVDGVV
jgi:hypothetical protein